MLVVWTLVGGRQELARVCTDLCSLPAFLCSYVLLSFYCCILHSWSLDPWSRPGMTALLAFVVFCGCLLCFLTEEHKNKSFTLILACSCKWICDTFLNQCLAPAVLSLRLSFVVKNRMFYGIANYAKLSFLTGIRNLMIMVCRMCFVLSLALCCFWDKIPGPGQGWRRRWHL